MSARCSGEEVSSFERSSPALRQFLHWFLVFTKPTGEGTAKLNLERQGYRVYHPRLVRTALYRGRWIERIVSLFPRYLFVQLDAEHQSLAPVRSTLGVVGVVRFGSDAAIVPDAVVAGLMHKADPESGLHRLAGGSPFEPGGRVNIIRGPFEGLDGIFQREAGEERVIVLLTLLGRDTPVGVSSGHIVPA